MLNMASVVLDKPVSSVLVCGGQEDNRKIHQAAAEQAKAMFDAEMQKINKEKKRITQLISAVEKAAMEIDEIRKRAVKNNQKQIALLAIEIARKIIAGEIEEGKYDICAMIEKALQASPSRDEAMVRLNPADYATVEEIIKSGESNFENVKFEADSSILPAHCSVATSKGVVEYFIDEQLNSISKSLCR